MSKTKVDQIMSLIPLQIPIFIPTNCHAIKVAVNLSLFNTYVSPCIVSTGEKNAKNERNDSVLFNNTGCLERLKV